MNYCDIFSVRVKFICKRPFLFQLCLPRMIMIMIIFMMLIKSIDQRVPGFINGYVRRFWQVCKFHLEREIGIRQPGRDCEKDPLICSRSKLIKADTRLMWRFNCRLGMCCKCGVGGLVSDVGHQDPSFWPSLSWNLGISISASFPVGKPA